MSNHANLVWLKQASRQAAEGLLGLASGSSGSALVEVRGRLDATRLGPLCTLTLCGCQEHCNRRLALRPPLVLPC